jgi:hypothetical protein
MGHPVLEFSEEFSSKIRDRHDSDPVRTQSTIYFPENNLHTTRGGNLIPSVPEAPPGWDTFATDESATRRISSFKSPTIRLLSPS